jgi:hypothetical protein
VSLKTVNPRTETANHGHEIRDRALELIRLGLPISARELAALLRLGISQFHKREKAGAFDDLRIPGAIGVRRFSGPKVQKFLAGELLDDSPRVFGRK